MTASRVTVEPDAPIEGVPPRDIESGTDGPDAEPPRDLAVLPLPTPGGRAGTARYEVVIEGWRFEVEVEDADRARLRERASRARRDEVGHGGPAEVRAIIPGVVVAVAVAAGDEIQAGQQLLVVEAMKMQNELRAPRGGVIQRVAVGPGSRIEVGDVLVVLA